MGAVRPALPPGPIVGEEVLRPRMVVLEGALIVEGGNKLLLYPTRYLEGWERCGRRLLRAGFEPQLMDADSEEWLFNLEIAIQVRVLFGTLGVLTQPGEAYPEPRQRLKERLLCWKAHEDLEVECRMGDCWGSAGALALGRA